ncbi:hypothetical protein CDIV41_260011 [Carnobacterium divergens]|nr:hypothetical protein CDIV41_260011 [Carnobacterium divergens]
MVRSLNRMSLDLKTLGRCEGMTLYRHLELLKETLESELDNIDTKMERVDDVDTELICIINELEDIDDTDEVEDILETVENVVEQLTEIRKKLY